MPADENSVEVLQTVKELVVSQDAEDAARRARRHIPTTDSTNVSLVTEGEICGGIQAVFAADRYPDGGARAQVYVIRVLDHYVVWTFQIDPASHYYPVLVLDPRLQIVGRYII